MILPVLGALVLLLLVVDVFMTVFHAGGRAGPLNRVQNRAVWRAFRALGGRRGAVLALAGPAMVVATLAGWVAFMVVGFALVYSPWTGSFLVSPGRLRTPWLEALFYSGSTASTLGLGDMVADHEALRLLTMLQALGGFALVSVSVTYLLAVYRELIMLQALASNISGYFRANDPGSPWFAEPGGGEAMARWTEGISASLLQTQQAHYQYPILHYFRPREHTRALAVQLGHLVRLRNRVRGLEDADRFVRGHPSFRAAAEAVEAYLDTVEQHFVPAGFGGDGLPEGLDPTERAYRTLLRHLDYE